MCNIYSESAMIDYTVLYFTNMEKSIKNNMAINNESKLWTSSITEVTLLPPLSLYENDTEYKYSKKVIFL